MIAEIQRMTRNTFFDEMPCPQINSEDIDFRAASEFFQGVSRRFTPAKRKSLALTVDYGGKEVPTQGAVLLFGKNRTRLFPDATIRCARFQGVTTTRFIDQVEIDEYLPSAVDSAIAFIERHTQQGIEIGRLKRKELPEYPPPVLREAVINAAVHADYSLVGSGIKVSIFDDRIEITNPGLLPFGLTLEAALSGVSRLRNRVIGRTFRELELIEQWGSGIGRMLAISQEGGLKPPRFEEIGTNFRVTLFGARLPSISQPQWRLALIDYLNEKGQISTHDASLLWSISDRSARDRLRKLVNEGTLVEVGTGPRDPRKVYILR